MTPLEASRPGKVATTPVGVSSLSKTIPLSFRKPQIFSVVLFSLQESFRMGVKVPSKGHHFVEGFCRRFLSEPEALYSFSIYPFEFFQLSFTIESAIHICLKCSFKEPFVKAYQSPSRQVPTARSPPLVSQNLKNCLTTSLPRLFQHPFYNYDPMQTIFCPDRSFND